MTHSLSPLSRYLNWGKLVLLAAPVAIIVQPQPSDTPLGVWGCPIRQAVGCPCPTCGMTRAVLSIGHGQWQAAWNYHAFSFLLVGGSVLVAAHAALELIGDRSIHTFYTKLWQQPKFYVILAVAYFLYYFYRLSSQGIP
jgi:Protein of unknown function (DUF2752)